MMILQYCSVCKAEYDMDVVPTADDDGVLWLQCPVCKGYLPKVKSSLQVVDAQREADEAATVSQSGTTLGNQSVSDPSAQTPEPEVVNIGDVAEVLDMDLDDVAAIIPDTEDEPSPEVKDAAVLVTDQDEGLELLEAMDVSKAVPYRPWQTYAAGDILHHLAWNDHGVVLDKEQLPGNRWVLKVRFAEAGLVRLIEDDGSRQA